MLKRVIVRGFRSLSDFDLEIREGLNVLVGPNGAGKTNIILFFGFLRNLSQGTIAEAVAQAGGVAEVFSKKGKERFQDTIHCKLAGTVEKEGISYSYEIEFLAKFNMTTQDIYFINQSLRIDESNGANHVKASWALGEADKPETDQFNVEYSREYQKNFSWIVKHIREDGFRKGGAFRQRLLISYLSAAGTAVVDVAKEISGRFVLNVVPSHVKKPEDSTRRPGIESDGSGVASTLYAIKRGKSFRDEPGPGGWQNSKSAVTANYNDVIDLVKVAVPSIKSIDVINDPFDNLLRCHVSIGKTGRSVVPLSALSDGTVKWLSLVLRLATSRSALLLEEPENYLHPLMQREIVRLLRDQMSNGGFSIVSTHSETMLNAVRAEELIVVSHGKNGTMAKRVSNATQVEEEINQTGFGLGYYYLADAVEAQ